MNGIARSLIANGIFVGAARSCFHSWTCYVACTAMYCAIASNAFSNRTMRNSAHNYAEEMLLSMAGGLLSVARGQEMNVLQLANFTFY